MHQGTFVEGVASRHDCARLREEGGKWLRRHRETAGKTVLDVVRALGSDFPSFVGGIERGAHRPPSGSYAAYAEILEMDRAVFARAMLKYYDTSIYDCLFGAVARNRRRKRSDPQRTPPASTDPVLLRPPPRSSAPSLSREEADEIKDIVTNIMEMPRRYAWTDEERVALRNANCRWPFNAIALSDGAYELSLYETSDYAAASYVDRNTGHTVLVVHKDEHGIRFVDPAGRSMGKEDQDWMGRMFDLEIQPAEAGRAVPFRTFGPEKWRPLSFDDDPS